MISTPSVFGEQVPREHAIPAGADRLGRADVVVLLQDQHLAADDARGRGSARDQSAIIIVHLSVWPMIASVMIAKGR